MKQTTSITKALIALIGFTFMLTSCSTWHYNKQQRVQIEPQYPIETKAQSIPVETPVQLTDKGSESTLGNDPTITNSDQDHHPLIKVKNKKSSLDNSITTQKAQSPFNLLVDHFKRHDKKVNKAEEVQKPALSGWVRIMVILLVVGFILILVGIFLSLFVYGGFWWLFYTVGALLILAGLIVMILGLVGLI